MKVCKEPATLLPHLSGIFILSRLNFTLCFTLCTMSESIYNEGHQETNLHYWTGTRKKIHKLVWFAILEKCRTL